MVRSDNHSIVENSDIGVETMSQFWNGYLYRGAKVFRNQVL